MNTNDNTIYREAVGYLSSRITGNPETAIILGSAWGPLPTRSKKLWLFPIVRFRILCIRQPQDIKETSSAAG